MAEAGADSFVFDALLTHLRQQGFDIGVDHYLRLQELLNKAGAECAPENLKTLLCPIFATSKAQQEQFHHVFDSYFNLFRLPMSEPAAPPNVEAGPTVTLRGAKTRNWLYLLAAAGLALFTLLAVWPSAPKPTKPAGADVTQNTPQPRASDEPQLPSQIIWAPRVTSESPPTPTPEQGAQSGSNEESYLYKFLRYRLLGLGQMFYGLLALWLAITAPLLLFLFHDQPLRSAQPELKLHTRLRFISLWLALLTQPLLWRALRRVEELWSFWDSWAWMTILGSLLFFLLHRRAPRDASPEGGRYERLRAPLLWLAALAALGLFLYGLMFHWAAFFAPLIFFIVYEWHQYKHRQLLLQKQRGRKPPFVWPVRLKAFAPRLFDSELFYQAARLMRRRQADEHFQLDIEATVAATTEALGYPTFKYKFATHPPEYLVLIDRASSRDHQAQLYNELAQALEREGNFVVRYFYDADPRVCCGDGGNDCLSLLELHSKCAGHRLLVIGDGAGLLDPITGRLASWTSIFADWPDRALLTPAPPALWGFREVTLAGLFLILPASLEGLLTLVTQFESLTETDVRAWRASSTDRPPALDNEPAEVVTALRAYLGEPTFRWLCACAVYPELHWNLTLYLGALHTMGGDLISEKNLLRLARLPWFRSGTIPDELRWLLLRELDEGSERAVRLAIIELLERDPPPRETYAADTYQLNLVVQRWLLRRDRHRRRELLAALQSAPQQQVLRDYTLLRFLEAPPASALNLYLPARLRKLFYRGGIPTFGLRTGTRLALALLLSAGGLCLYKLTSSEAKNISVQNSVPSATPSDLSNVLPTDNKLPAAEGKLYRDMSDGEKSEFINRRAQHIALMMGGRPYAFTPEVIQKIKSWVDGFANRVGNQRTGLWAGDTTYVLARGRQYAPVIIRAFNDHGVPPVVGLYIPFIETEYTNIATDNTVGAAGLFQIIGPFAESYGVPRAERTDVSKSAGVAARYLRDNILSFGDDQLSVVLSIQSYNRAPASLRRDLSNVLSASNSEDRERNYWMLFADPSKTSNYFQREGVHYVPRFFASAIVGETPWAFGIQMQPLSTYTSTSADTDGRSTNMVSIEMSDGASDVYRDGWKVCTTPCSLDAPVGATLKLLFRRDGFKDEPEEFIVTENKKVWIFTMQQQEAASDVAFGSLDFMHGSAHHVSLACASCHERAEDNSPRPAFAGKASLPGHKACTNCHIAQFMQASTTLCIVCHTNVGGNSNPPVKTFPPLKSFNTKFDHRQHNTGTARPASGCTTCHQVASGSVLSTVSGISAHASCYTCHTPNAQAGGRNIGSCGVCHVPSLVPAQ
jgi:Transglycosylase SLT domain